jgi:hypothetical protein
MSMTLRAPSKPLLSKSLLVKTSALAIEVSNSRLNGAVDTSAANRSAVSAPSIRRHGTTTR